MAITVTVVDKATDFSSKKHVTVDITFDASYPTGGEEPTGGWLKVLGLSTVEFAVFDPPGKLTTVGADFYVVPEYNRSTNKLKLQDVVGINGAELGNATDVSDLTVRGRFTGNSR